MDLASLGVPKPNKALRRWAWPIMVKPLQTVLSWTRAHQREHPGPMKEGAPRPLFDSGTHGACARAHETRTVQLKQKPANE